MRPVRCREVIFRKFALAMTILGLLSLMVYAPTAQSGGRFKKQGGKFGWLADYNAAKTLAKKTGKPMMLVFRCVP